jgi:lysophospholipase L1-like esterase
MRRLLPGRLVALLAAVPLAAGLAAGCSPGSARPGSAAARPGPAARYYLALGDSLARGVQADLAGASVPTRDGYPDQLYTRLRPAEPDLRLVKLGCPGETTSSMITGRHCSYPAGSQLDQAVAFLRGHRGTVALITLDIGANDPGSCFTNPAPVAASCAAGPVPATAAGLGTILARLRAAAGPQVPVIGMNYYLPELAEWRAGAAGAAAARRSTRLAMAFDQVLSRVYRAHGDGVADVAGAFRSTNFTGRARLPDLGLLPRNVADVCAWTWACAAPPRGPNKHPNTAGYAVIARAFLTAYRR